jgi:hypothetical protein
MESLYGLATIIGPIALLAIMIWVILRNRQSKTSDRTTERATRENYQAEDRQVHREENL